MSNSDKRPKIVIAPDSFKGCMDASTVARAIANGLSSVFPYGEILCCPMGDGGEGTAELYASANNGVSKVCDCHNPLFSSMKSEFFVINDGFSTEIILDLAGASGLSLLKSEERDAKLTSTYGTGEVILESLSYNPTIITLCLGGSATIDCGIGILGALGAEFFDENGIFTPKRLRGGELGKIRKINVSSVRKRFSGITFRLACDVKTPLVGRESGEGGAVEIFGRQKGISFDEMGIFCKSVEHFCDLLEDATKCSVRGLPGGGAAGGVGATLAAVLDAEIIDGATMMIQSTGLAESISNSDFVITGEGKSDYQTLLGKVPYSVLRESRKHGIPVILLSGEVEDREQLRDAGFSDIIGINENMDKILNLLDKEIAFYRASCAIVKNSKKLKNLTNIF
ncbi:MAG: glycerate kinase [Prevotella sp.]|nr:glycerate kinase [Bacteroides sp.]MCM1366371.1 glycerate kinase [Prevotella sp.]MCM1436700.1 glycerate kinase [Prevotella sp.]